MITKLYIEATLKKLDALYNRPKLKENPEYFSKLALIESCGWIEESFDDIVSGYKKYNLKNEKNISFYKGKIKRTHGFDYENDIRPLIILLIGIKKFDIIESKLNRNGEIDILRASLLYFKERRDKVAHTHIKNVTGSLDAPSKIYSEWMIVYKILKKMEHEIKVLQ